jgi:hypothetical protein
MKDAIVRDDFIAALIVVNTHTSHALAWATGVISAVDENGEALPFHKQRYLLGQELFQAQETLSLLIADLGVPKAKEPESSPEDKKEPVKH